MSTYSELDIVQSNRQSAYSQVMPDKNGIPFQAKVNSDGSVELIPTTGIDSGWLLPTDSNLKTINEFKQGLGK